MAGEAGVGSLTGRAGDFVTLWQLWGNLTGIINFRAI
jgi:hypothetical protein